MHAPSPFEAFDAWLEQNLPECFADLRPGADPSQTKALARAIGALELPRGWVDLYRWHDGQTATVVIEDRHDVGRVFGISKPANTHFLDAIQNMTWPVRGRPA